MQLQWKNFNIDLSAVKTWIAANASPYFNGLVADSSGLIVSLNLDVPEATMDAIQAYWDGLTDQSSEALSYKSSATLKAEREEEDAAILALKEGAIAKTWDTMTTAEKKAVSGLRPTRAELGL